MRKITIEALRDYLNERALSKNAFWQYSRTPRRSAKFKPQYVVTIQIFSDDLVVSDADMFVIEQRQREVLRYLNENKLRYCLYSMDNRRIKVAMRDQAEVAMFKLAMI